MKQNKKTVMIIGCIITICTFIAAVLIGWNHMVKITKGPKNEKEIGYYQWNHDQMDSFLDITTFTYHGDRYETADGGGDGAMSFGYLEASMKGRKPAFWLKETMNQTDKKIVKTISWWKAAAEPVYALSSNSGCDMVFLDPSDKAMMQTDRSWKRIIQILIITILNLQSPKQMNERRFHQKKRNSMPDCSRFEKMLKMLKNNIPFMEKVKIISHMSNLIS